MNGRNITNNQYNLFLKKLDTRLSFIMEEPFEYKQTEYTLISKALRKMIMDEISQTLSRDQLSTTQCDILDHADIDELVIKMVGDINCSKGNVVTGLGIESSGLAKIYYNCLNMKVGSFIDDLTFGKKHTSASDNKDFLQQGKYRVPMFTQDKDMTDWERDVKSRDNTIRYFYVASHDKLNKSFTNNRQKPIISLFLTALAAQATAEELQKLSDETTTKGKSPLVDVLAEHRKQKGMFKTDKDTSSLDNYKKVLNGLDVDVDSSSESYKS